MRRPFSFLLFALIIIFVLAGAALVLYATTLGIGVGGDATIYLTTARNLLAGKGLTWPDPGGIVRLLPYTPPFYPLTLSAIGFFGVDFVSGARWWNVILFGATIALVGSFFYRYTGRAWLAGILSGLLAFSPVILAVHLWAMSEPLFLFLGFAGLLILLEYTRTAQAGWLVGGAALTGLAFLTRYMGVAYVITGGLLLLLYAQGDFLVRQKLSSGRTVVWIGSRPTSVFYYGLLAILPTLVWLVIDYFATGTVGSRSAQPTAAYWQRFLEMGPALQKIVLFWMLPDSILTRLPEIVKIALWLVPLAAMVGVSVWLFRRSGGYKLSDVQPIGNTSVRPTRLATLFGLFIVVYLLVLVVVQVFTFPPITLASRMLSPVHLAALALLFSLLDLLLARLDLPRLEKPVAAVIYLFCLGLLGSYLFRGALIARDYHQSGIGYTAPAWVNSGVIASLRALPEDVPIISNETTAIMFLTGRTAYPLKEIYQSHPLEKFTSYGQGEDTAQQVFRQEGGALVLFNGTLAEDFGMYGERAGERIRALTSGLFRFYESEDGAIYFYRPYPGNQ